MALKEIDLKGQSREQTEFEIKVMHRLKHKSLIRIIDEFMLVDKYYIVLEVAMGNNNNNKKNIAGTLEPYCKTLNVEQAIRLFREICDGVNHMHKSEIVHLDLYSIYIYIYRKPANIFITDLDMELSHIKIGDFGISNNLSGDLYIKTDFGSQEYVSPEIWKNEKFKFEPDIFALGVILYEMLMGKKPFNFGENDPIDQQICQREVRPSEITVNIHEKLFAGLICRMLKKERKCRIQIDELLRIIFIYIIEYLYI